VRLTGYYVRSRHGAAVVLYPRAGGTQRHARMLVRHGFGGLALDARGYRASEGDPNAFGWGGTRDIDAAVAYLQRRPGLRLRGIGGLGLSVGGEQMLRAVAGNPALRAVVSDGAGERSVNETLARGWRAALAIPEALVQTAAIAVFSGHAPPPSLTSVAPRISPRPAFFVYAEHGVGGEDLNRTFYNRAREPKQIWRVPAAGHTGGLRAAPREYERRVVAFLLEHLRHSRG
jgi:dienelactone hydrolase